MAVTERAGLRQLVLFTDCSVDELRQVATLGRRRIVTAGETIIHRGEQVPDLLMIMHGAVRVSRTGLEGSLGVGDLVGELSVLTGEPASATVTATEPTELLTIDEAHLPTLLAMDSVGPRLRAIAKARVTSGDVMVTAASVPVIRKPPRVRGRGAGLDAGRRHRSARTWTLTAFALVVAGTSTFVLTQRNATTSVALDTLLADADTSQQPIAAPARADQGSVVLVDPATSSASIIVGDVTDVAASDPPLATGEQTSQPDTPPAQASSVAPADPAASAAPSASANASPRYRQPVPGVYTYETSGHESISIAGANHQYPAETHAVVKLTDGCHWTLVHHVLEEHRDSRELCSDQQAVSTLWFSTVIEFFGQADGLTYVCSPPAKTLAPRPVGATSEGACATDEGEGEARYVAEYAGPETLDVGGQGTATDHIRIDFTMTGSARGTSHVEQWLDPTTGMIVRMERTVDTLAKGVWGDVRYQEDATFHLVSMTPRT